MTAVEVKADSAPFWFVGAFFKDVGDQTERFLSEGGWELRNPTARELALVKSMRPGERVAIKSTYVRKLDLPFDNRGQSVSVMAIKATGTVTENPGDGERARVRWHSAAAAREWYFYTFRGTVWRLVPGHWMDDALAAFAFDGVTQDIARFAKDPFWHERFGPVPKATGRFAWTKFYTAIADALLQYRSDRSGLVARLKDLSKRVEGLGYLSEDKLAGGLTGFVRDICPFTTMGLFNRGTTDANRKKLAAELAKTLGVEEAVPHSFEGIPVLNNMQSWYFEGEVERKPDQIDTLWEVFAIALRFADGDEAGIRAEFESAFDRAMSQPNVGWKLTFGLYWARPWSFVSLDRHSRQYMERKLNVQVGKHGPKGRSGARDYLTLLETLDARFLEPGYPVHSYPELSLSAWQLDLDAPAPEPDGIDVDAQPPAPIVPYAVDDIVAEGCFLPRAELDRIVGRLREKKNLILQGAPGTGKSWLARRLAFAVMGQRDEKNLRSVQFHPNLSYEEFVRGLRPKADGTLALVDGVFLQAIEAAKGDPAARVVVVIEEINRGNPAQVFGELLTLLEAGKRTPSEALELCYPDADGQPKRVHVPENLYVIGTMNIADRSLALVDFALRRRFAFVTLEPRLGPAWRQWVGATMNVDPALIADIEARIERLNATIASDGRLGAAFKVGHSYVTPAYPLAAGTTQAWFREVVETEIGPLLDEYWFDAPEESRKAREALLAGW